MPTEILHGDLWPHRVRLPLGDGWAGFCTAPGHEGTRPTGDELKDCCNLGYATSCPRLPPDRDADAVRFIVKQNSNGATQIAFARERSHAPVDHGVLEYDSVLGRWISQHPETRLQRMAECYLEAVVLRRRGAIEPA